MAKKVETLHDLYHLALKEYAKNNGGPGGLKLAIDRNVRQGKIHRNNSYVMYRTIEAVFEETYIFDEKEY